MFEHFINESSACSLELVFLILDSTYNSKASAKLTLQAEVRRCICYPYYLATIPPKGYY